MKKLHKPLTRVLLIVMIAFLYSSTYAQFAYNYAKAGDDYYRKGDYYSAAQYYEKYLNGSKAKANQDGFDPYVLAKGSKGEKVKTSNRNEIVFKTGESYRLLNNHVKAEPYYLEATKFEGQYPLARYWYAKSLRANSKFDEAEAEFKTFLKEYATEDNFKADADKELKNLEFRSAELKKADLYLYKVDKMSLNTSGANSAPTIVNNTLVFNSTRQDEKAASGKNPYINNIYQTGLTNGGNVVKFDIALGKDEHFERPSFTEDGQKMYVTKWSLSESKKSAFIYVSIKKNNKWSDPVLLEGTVNTNGYSSQQPYVTPDGKFLYFASDKPGGYGKMDIYVAPISEDGKIGEATNLGSEINTADDDEAPYYFAPSGILVFSSNGRVGMGGFDFYQSKGSVSTWGKPENMGYPINSVKDDIYLVSLSAKHLLDTIYFSSDRGSECCLELFAANKIRPKRIIAGKIIDCLTAASMPNATIKAYDPANENLITSVQTDEMGRYNVSVEDDQDVKLTAEAEGYTPKVIDLKKTAPADTLVNVAVCLEPPEKPFEAENKPVIIDNIYFDFDQAVLKPESFQVLDSVVGLMERYPTMVLEVSGHTDSKGSDEHNQKLSEDRAKAFVQYVIGKGIDAARLEAKGFGETRPIAPNTINGKDNPPGRDKNRRTEIKVLHY